MTISVVMCSGGYKPTHLRNTLYSWSRLNTPFEFTLVSTNKDGTQVVEEIAKDFSFITRVVEPPEDDTSEKWARTARSWTREGKKSLGDYVIFAMEDEIVGDYNILDVFLSLKHPYRASTRTYFLSPNETYDLDSLGWKDNPRVLEEYPDFWSHTSVQGADNGSNTVRTACDASLHAHIIGAPREHWEYMNWFRTEKYGYFWLDQDMVLRENLLKRPCLTLPIPVCCYHQWHPLLPISTEDREFEGFLYETEAQARLLEPARRSRNGEYKLPDGL